MNATPVGVGTYWFVGVAWGKDDQTSRFLREGIWENGYRYGYLDVVKSIRVGDRMFDAPEESRKATKRLLDGF
ncbi:MAG: hypothetical protein LBE84_07815 [Planctomycetota bacterium]|jgi:5-methylcytosine-specific restriction protein B|nr:hypothetical protein [Planctomycetota bacterium]